ncbi:mevalonate kinase [Chryseobacterium ginsenosidimutans]|nr:mevalonate kinase [Chryseobacterium ginsenosidimutans]
MTNPLFYAKIILFGEYGMIEDSQGLVVPYSFYKGTLKFSESESEFEKKSNGHLQKYSDYLADLNLSDDFRLDVKKFKQDISNGLFFDSNIPQGYGVGSFWSFGSCNFRKIFFKKT